MRMTSRFPKTYEEVVDDWRKADIDPSKVFTDEFLVHLTSESSGLEDIEVTYHSTREIFESETVQNYSGDIRALYSVMNNRNVAEMLSNALGERKPVTEDLIKEIHRLMMFGSIDRRRYEDNEERAGEYKKHDYCVGRYGVGYEPEEVSSGISEMIDLISKNESKDTLKVATVFHCIFEYIHPFSDGNGRVGRWLLNYFLVLNNHPPVIIKKEDRHSYYNALEAYDTTEDYYPLYELLKKCTVDSQPYYRYLLK